MKHQKLRRLAAFTLLDLLILVGVAVCVVMLLLPALVRSHPRPSRSCYYNLREIGVSFLLWQGDNGDRFPMDATNGLGQAMFPEGTRLETYFGAMSNELNNPKILACPADKKRSALTNFSSDLNASHISYFINLDAAESISNSFLAGDSNVTNDMQLNHGLLTLSASHPAGWTKERHYQSGTNGKIFIGNVLMVDGSVHQLTSRELQIAVTNTGLATNRLL